MERVRQRLLLVTRLLGEAHIAYAVVGGNAVAAWVARVDEGAVRNTQDVDILLRREDLAKARTALESAGFHYRHVASVDMFLDSATGKARDAVHVVFAGEKVRPEYPLPTPTMEERESLGDFHVLTLAALVRMKLTSYRDKDRTHLRDLLEVGLVDESWVNRLPSPLNDRLQALIDDPLG